MSSFDNYLRSYGVPLMPMSSIRDLLDPSRPSSGLASLLSGPGFQTGIFAAPPAPLKWDRPPDGGWWFLSVAAGYAPNVSGVYVIWRGRDRRAVRLGQGLIGDRLTCHNRDRDILQHDLEGLFATWARVAPSQCDGVERYLAEHYSPIVGSRFPQCSPTTVNLPG